jgi:hypothetical protein
MPMRGERHRFTTWQISGAPAAPGVYALWDRDEAIYVGATRGDATIRSCLQDHYARRVQPHDATHFTWEIAASPVQREAELLDEFRIANSRLPRCNVRGK